MVYHFKTHTDEDGFWAECIEIHSVASSGKTFEELLTNCRQSLEDHLNDDEQLFPKPYENIKVSGRKLFGIKVPRYIVKRLVKENRLYRCNNEY